MHVIVFIVDIYMRSERKSDRYEVMPPAEPSQLCSDRDEIRVG